MCVYIGPVFSEAACTRVSTEPESERRRDGERERGGGRGINDSERRSDLHAPHVLFFFRFLFFSKLLFSVIIHVRSRRRRGGESVGGKRRTVTKTILFFHVFFRRGAITTAAAARPTRRERIFAYTSHDGVEARAKNATLMHFNALSTRGAAYGRRVQSPGGGHGLDIYY